MRSAPNRMKIVGMLAACAAVVLLAAPSRAAAHTKIKDDLSITGVDMDARGQIRLKIRARAGELEGQLQIRTSRLAENETYEVVLQGVHLGTLVTNSRGKGKVRFRTEPKNDSDLLLGIDPRGKQLEIRNASGDNILEVEIREDGLDPNDVRCCVPHDVEEGGQPECEDRTASECAALGGTDLGPGSCLPNPCESGTPPTVPEQDIVCCIPHDSGPECEDRTAAQCSAAGGINLGVGVCLPNPCAANTPGAPATVQCCLPDDSGPECEDRTAALCAELGGVDMGPGTCSPNPCEALPPPPDADTRCCLPDDSGPECEDRTPEECAFLGGVDIGPGICALDSCDGVALPPPDPDTRCCVPDDKGPKCEDRTPAECALRGGVDIGPGSCSPNPC